MKTAIFLLLFSIPLISFSQNYIPINFVNAKFHSTEYIGFIPCSIDKLYRYLKDTTIGGTNYHLFKTEQFGSIPPNCIAPGVFQSLFRNDTINKKVYTRVYNQDSLNYDFSLLPGDTSKAYHDGYNVFQNAPTVLISIDSELINNIWHRRFNFKQFQGQFTQYNHTIIEGIGATYLHFFENAASLVCYSVNNNIIYQEGNYLCEIPLKSNEPELSETRIYFDNQLHITGFTGLLEIYDTQGSIIFKNNISSNYHSELLHFAKGIHLIRLSNNEKVIVRKIFIQ